MSTSKYISCALNIQSFYRKVPPTIGSPMVAETIKQVEQKRWNQRIMKESHDDNQHVSISTNKSGVWRKKMINNTDANYPNIHPEIELIEKIEKVRLSNELHLKQNGNWFTYQYLF